jgi:protein SCO1
MFAARMLAGLIIAGCTASCTPGQELAQNPVHDVDPSGGPVSLFAYPWIWTDERGQNATFSVWRGEPLVVTAIYTQCRATCPRTIAKLRKLDDAFRSEKRAVQFLLVTLDPTSDTPERLSRFKAAERLPDSWHLLTGPIGETRELSDLLDIHVVGGGAHLVHNARIVVFDPEGLPVRTFSGFSLDNEAIVAPTSPLSRRLSARLSMRLSTEP